jgi:hypothetical protein
MGILEPAGLVLDMKSLNLVLVHIAKLAEKLDPCTCLCIRTS